MPVKPCECEEGHKFSAEQAAALNGQCDKDGTAITCEDAPSDAVNTLVANKGVAKKGVAKKGGANKGVAKKGASSRGNDGRRKSRR